VKVGIGRGLVKRTFCPGKKAVASVRGKKFPGRANVREEEKIVVLYAEVRAERIEMFQATLRPDRNKRSSEGGRNLGIRRGAPMGGEKIAVARKDEVNVRNRKKKEKEPAPPLWEALEKKIERGDSGFNQ